LARWVINQGKRAIKLLYYYSAVGASRAQNVNHFLLGPDPPLLLYIEIGSSIFALILCKNNLKFDFISWPLFAHCFQISPNRITNLNTWLSKMIDLPLILKSPQFLGEWGMTQTNQ